MYPINHCSIQAHLFVKYNDLPLFGFPIVHIFNHSREILNPVIVDIGLNAAKLLASDAICVFSYHLLVLRREVDRLLHPLRNPRAISLYAIPSSRKIEGVDEVKSLWRDPNHHQQATSTQNVRCTSIRCV